MAFAGVPLVQVPPEVVLVYVVVFPTQSVVEPVIVWATGADTVTVFVAVFTQPPVVVTEYVITDEPAATPVTTPVAAFTVAFAGVPLVQVPPEVVEL